MNIKYQWCSEDDDSDKAFLGWIYSRLQDKARDIESAPHMQRLERLIAKIPGKMRIGCDCSVGDICPQGKDTSFGVRRCNIWKE